MTSVVIVLGASVAGIPITHYLLKYTMKLHHDLRVILISPNSHLYWNLASTRGILPNKFKDEELFYPLDQAFSKYPTEKFQRILGVAEKVDPEKSEVTVLLNGTSNERQTLHYHAIVVATGSSAREGMPWKNLESTERTKAALASYRQQIGAAKTVVVAGAGTTGSEVAGELGTAFGKSGEKNIILVSRGDLPLGQDIMHSVRDTVRQELEKLQVRVICNAKIKNVTPSGPSEPKNITILSTSGKEETIKADVYLPTFGVQPNSNFIPQELLDDSGFIQQTSSLRSPSYDNVFVVGDVGSLQLPTAVNADAQALHAAKNVEAFLAGAEIKEFKPDPKLQFAVAMGDRGTGQFGNWKLWSILIWWVKGRYLGTQYAGEIAAGTRTMLSKTLK